MKIIDLLVDLWIRRCRHDSRHVAADILEGSANVEVKYCRRCGAVRPSYSREFRRPQPLWFPLVVIVGMLALEGCSAKLTGNLTADLHNDAVVAQAKAQAVANAGDQAAAARVPCWAAWASITSDTGTAGGLIFTPVETTLEVQSTLNSTACQAIAGQVMTAIVNKLPGL
jgi:hypothetical protein